MSLRSFDRSIFMLALFALALNASAQDQAAGDAQEVTTEVVTVSAAPEAKVQVVQENRSMLAADTQVVAQPVAQQAAQVTVTQPTTLVESTPLVKSRAQDLRNARQGAEIQTEQKIVEKLEESRLKDEQKRMQNLFGDKEVTSEASQVKAEEQKAQPQYILVQPAQQSATVDNAKLKSEIAESVKADLKADSVKTDAKDVVEAAAAVALFHKRRMSFGGGISFFNYDAFNIQSTIGVSAVFGYEFRDRLSLDTTFMFSNHTSNDAVMNFVKFDQYNLDLAIRWGILPYFVRPVIGASVSYTYRSYYVPNMPGFDMSGNAFDASFLAGVEAELTRNLMLTLDYKMYYNIQNNYGDNDAANMNVWLPRIQETEYDMTSLGLRYLF